MGSMQHSEKQKGAAERGREAEERKEKTAYER